MASRFVVRGFNCSCGRVTVAPGALLRGSDAPDRPQSFFSFSQLRRQHPIWVMLAVSRLRFARSTGPRSSASGPRGAHRNAGDLNSAFRFVRGRPSFETERGPGLRPRLPFPCGHCSSPLLHVSAHRGASSTLSNSSLQRTRVPSSRFFQHCGSPLSSVSLDSVKNFLLRIAAA